MHQLNNVLGACQNHITDIYFIRICQPKNSDVHLGFASVNITFEGRLILMLTEKEFTNDCLSFPSVILSIFILIHLLKSSVLSALKTNYFNNIF